MKEQKLNKAWIVRWVAYASDSEKVFANYGLTGNVIDFLSARHDFDKYIRTYAENLYRQKMLSLSERFMLAHYNHVSASEKIFGSAIPVFTHYTSEHYKKRMSCFENNTLNDPECVKLRENWEDYPMYVTVGHNPAVEIWKVFDLKLEATDDGLVKLTWHEPKADGTKVQKEEVINDLIY